MSPMKVVIRNILADQQKGRSIDASADNAPDPQDVIRLTESLLNIIFPMRSRKEPIKTLDTAISLLEAMLPRKTVLAFLLEIPRIRSIVQTDVDAAFDGDPAAIDHREIILCYPGIFAGTVYRLAHMLYQMDVPMLPRMMTEYAHSRTGIDIHPGAQIGSHFFIDHGTGVVIGQTTVIGDHVKIYQGVTLGGRSTRGGQRLRGKKRHPTVKDHVTIYANASILGGETVIGRGCVIGAGVFITNSVPPNTVVTGKTPAAQAPDGKSS